jgi:cell shape-determining protein MreC
MEYVPAAYHEQVSEFLENHRQTRAVLEEICEINLELLRRREELG